MTTIETPGKQLRIAGRSVYISIRLKLLLTFTLLFSVVFAGAFYWFYSFAEQLAIDNVGRELTVVAETTASEIDGDAHELLYRSNLKGGSPLQVPDERYLRLVDWLGVVKLTHGTVTDLDGTNQPRLGIYTYVPTSNPRVIRFVGSASAPLFLSTVTKKTKGFSGAYFRQLYVAPAEMLQGFERIYVDMEHALPDQWGTWYSAYAPIRNSRGETVGAVGVDLRDTTVQALRTQIQNAALPAFAITYIILFSTVWLVSYHISRPLLQLTRFAEQVAAGNYIHDKVVSIPGPVRDETTTLADVFVMMVDKVREREESLKQQVVELKIEIDQTRRQKQVSEIVETELFQNLQSKARNLRNRRRAADKEEAEGIAAVGEAADVVVPPSPVEPPERDKPGG